MIKLKSLKTKKSLPSLPKLTSDNPLYHSNINTIRPSLPKLKVEIPLQSSEINSITPYLVPIAATPPILKKSHSKLWKNFKKSKSFESEDERKPINSPTKSNIDKMSQILKNIRDEYNDNFELGESIIKQFNDKYDHVKDPYQDALSLISIYNEIERKVICKKEQNKSCFIQKNIIFHRLKMMYSQYYLRDCLLESIKIRFGLTVYNNIFIGIFNALSSVNIFGLACQRTDLDWKIIVNCEKNDLFNSTDFIKFVKKFKNFYERSGILMEIHEFTIMTLDKLIESMHSSNEELFYESIRDSIDIIHDPSNIYAKVWTQRSNDETLYLGYNQLIGDITTKYTYKSFTKMIGMIGNHATLPKTWRYNIKYGLIRLETFARQILFNDKYRSNLVETNLTEQEAKHIVRLCEFGILIENLILRSPNNIFEIDPEYETIKSSTFESLMIDYENNRLITSFLCSSDLINVDDIVDQHIYNKINNVVNFSEQLTNVQTTYNYLLSKKKFKEVGFLLFSHLDKISKNIILKIKPESKYVINTTKLLLTKSKWLSHQNLFDRKK